MAQVRDEADVLLRGTPEVQNRKPGLVADVAEELLQTATGARGEQRFRAPAPREAQCTRVHGLRGAVPRRPAT